MRHSMNWIDGLIIFIAIGGWFRGFSDMNIYVNIAVLLLYQIANEITRGQNKK